MHSLTILALNIAHLYHCIVILMFNFTYYTDMRFSDQSTFYEYQGDYRGGQINWCAYQRKSGCGIRPSRLRTSVSERCFIRVGVRSLIGC